MAGEVALIILLFVTLLLAKALGELMERLRQPALVGEILAGVIIANLVLRGVFVPYFSLAEFFQLDPTVTDPVVAATATSNLHFLEALADLGVIFLIFAVGLHIKPSDLRKVGKLASMVAVLGVVIPFILGFLFIWVTDPAVGSAKLAAAMFVAAAMVATSIGITAQVLRERNVLKSKEAMVILGAAVIDDILGIMVLTIAIGVGSHQAGGGDALIYRIGIVAALSSLFVLFFLFVGPRLVRRVAHPENPRAILNRLRTHNAPFVVALLFCFGVSALATFFTLAAIIGAFLAGMAFAEVAEKHRLAESFEPLNAFFVPFFFLVIGLKVNVGELLSIWPVALMITVLAIVGKLVGCTLAARPMGRTSSLIVGVGMIPRGEVGIIVAAAGLGAAAISQGLYAAVVVMSIATSVIAPSILGRLFQTKAAEDAAIMEKAKEEKARSGEPPGTDSVWRSDETGLPEATVRTADPSPQIPSPKRL